MDDHRIQGVSSYLLTPGAAPSLTAGLLSGELPAPAPPAEQALMRLHTYGTFLRAGWIRRGTDTYLNPNRIASEVVVPEKRRVQAAAVLGMGGGR